MNPDLKVLIALNYEIGLFESVVQKSFLKFWFFRPY